MDKMNLLYDLLIDSVPVGPNGPKGLLRMHWASRQKYNKDWAWFIRSALGSTHPRIPVPERVQVHIMQGRKRLMDTDNLVASCKPILDGLRDWALITNDDPSHCMLEVEQVKSKQVYTRIRVYELVE